MVSTEKQKAITRDVDYAPGLYLPITVMALDSRRIEWSSESGKGIVKVGRGWHQVEGWSNGREPRV